MFQPGAGAPMELPDVNFGAAWAAVAALKSATALAQLVGQQLSTAEAELPEWSGPASDEYRSTKTGLINEVDRLAMTSSAVATAVSGWADVAAPAVTQLREVIAEAKAAEVRQRALQAAGNYSDLQVEARVGDAWTAYERVGLRYLEACRELHDRLGRIRDHLPQRPWDARDNASGFVSKVWQNTVADPAGAVWGLTGDAFVDRTRWWSNVKETAIGVVLFDVEMVKDPVGTARLVLADQLEFDAWRQGHYGEGLGAAATIYVGRARELRMPESHKLQLFAHNMADKKAPLPALQSSEEMLGGVDLPKSEHYLFGHTQRRHEQVTQVYLQDRLVNGTLTDDGVRGYKPRSASAWYDRATAEAWLTETLRRNEPDFLQWAASGERSLVLETTTPKPVGEVMKRSGSAFRIDDANHIKVWVQRTPSGVFVTSSYLEYRP